MSELIASWIENVPIQLILLIPVLALLECVFFVGLFVSGVFLLSTCSLVYAQGNTSLYLIIMLAFAGAFTGDHIGYYFGHRSAPYLWQFRWFRKKVIRQKMAYQKFRQLIAFSAPWAISLGRLVPAVRSISPAVAGIAGIKPGQFFAYDLLACSIWAGGLSVLVVGINQFI
jgi:membrane-associated protein